jgi:excinuclease ABC subunit A
MKGNVIQIHGARQNNLKNLSLALPLNELIVVTGVSGSGKSSLVFDTLYAEGQRRYVETFSPYARQFLDRMDKPQVDAIDGIPPAIAIDQTNPVRTSRSTVGTMTELNDHLKLLFARAAQLYCRGCGRKVTRDTPDSIYAALAARAKTAGDPRLIVTFPVAVPKNFSEKEVKQLLAAQGYTRIHKQQKNLLEIVQDRLRMSSAERVRVIECLEAALRIGQGRVNVYVAAEDTQHTPSLTLPPQGGGKNTPSPLTGEGGDGGVIVWRFSTTLHCADCDIHYSEPTPSLFSFNSPLGACDACRGFGRVIGIDFGLIIPDASKTLRAGAVRPWQTPSFHECQDDLEKYARKRGIPLDTPWRELTPMQREWVLEGEPKWVSWRKSWPGTWYGVRIFFKWLETKAYKMHIRVLLSKYRAYTPCEACDGARLKPDALAWRLGAREDADRVLPSDKRHRAKGIMFDDDKLAALPGLTVHDLMLLPIERTRGFIEHLHLPWAPARKTSQTHESANAGAMNASGVASPEGARRRAEEGPLRGSDPADVHKAGIDAPMASSTVASPQAGPLLHVSPAPAPPSDVPLDQATDLLLAEIRARLSYLTQVGLGYLTLDRQSRTLSGGEVQRINLTTALGTSLVNTLFVLDEPSIGLHPRDMGRVIGVMQRLRDAGNSLVVVEHEPQIMFAADRILDLGPGPGERGGEVVCFGTPDEVKNAPRSLTGDYLSGRKRASNTPTLARGHVTGETGSLREARLDPASRPGSLRERRVGGILPLKGGGENTPSPSQGEGGDGGINANKTICILGAAEHNLKTIDVAIPLNRLVCVTGVSGSGKSTLVQDVLYAALLKHQGKPTETPGAHRAQRGFDLIDGVVMVDQSPIGRTTRSNPASYVGAFDAIRALFAQEPLAKERGYTQGTFSFNAGNGRCPACGGNGFERVEMQFLSDVYLRCPDCDGKRYRPEVLEVTLNRKSIADALDMTVSEALAFFAAHDTVQTALKPLADVGLEYLRLGQPVPTLSGGEAQRLKLAGHLADAAKRSPHPSPLPSKRGEGKKKSAGAPTDPLSPVPGERARVRGGLFLFDEPTTGLHFDDVAKLLRAFRQLIAAGNSLVVIEHNLDVIAACDWIIDLGPEGGDAGGEIVCTGTPGEVMRHASSHTGKALREYEIALSGTPIPTFPLNGGGRSEISAQRSQVMIPSPSQGEGQGGGSAVAKPAAAQRDDFIRIHNAREHNLKNIDVAIPRNQFTVVTGVSGSGKSTLAFDIVFAEGQRRYLESLNAYARQFVQPASRPDVDAIFGIPPTVAIEQRVSRGGRKSTVATLTEIYHFLRLLFVKLGTQYCPDCNVPIEPQSIDAIAARILRDYRNQRIGLLAPLVVARKGYYTDLAKWAAGRGCTHLRVDGEFIATAQWPRLDRFREHSIELPVADVRVAADNEATLRAELARAIEFGKGVVRVLAPLEALEQAMAKRDPALARMNETVFSVKRACPSCSRSFPELDPRLFSFNSRHGWCGECYGTGLKLTDVGWNDERANTGTEDHVLDSWIEWLEVDETCPACNGKRLNREALAVRYRNQSIADITALAVGKVAAMFRDIDLDRNKNAREAGIARDLLAELKSRLNFLNEVGLSYLALDRAAPTLSGGEAQRIRLASQLGSNLRGVCYILDEPTIGLHHRDNEVLLDTLEKLEARGNTLLVVEHDEDTIRRAAHVIDLGPGAGKLGGRVIAEGSAAELMINPESVTGRFLAHPLKHPLHPARPVNRQTSALEITGACLHNLQHINLRVPLGRLTVVTGVSGSGKSTLARDVLYANLARRVGEHNKKKKEVPILGCRDLTGWQHVGRVLEVDQTPIGKTPRSCPATYVGFWDAIRRLFAGVSEARMRGYTASRFSFNISSSKGGASARATPETNQATAATGRKSRRSKSAGAGGRCEACEGQGIKRIEMSFLPDVRVTCEVCGGARFSPETLAVRFKGKSIGDILALSVDEAVEFFSAHASIHHALRLLQDVGLGYLTLGQQSPTLSGGEAQRIKLVTELAKVRTPLPSPPPQAREGANTGGAADKDSTVKKNISLPHEWGRARVGAQNHTLYVLDEPTVGLHMADVEKLIRVLHRLVDAGNTVVVIEHNLDVMADADWIIDLGPEGGDAGGRIVAQGAPTAIIKDRKRSHTTRVLAEFLAARGV